MTVSERTAGPGVASAVTRGTGLLVCESACPQAVRQAFAQTFLNMKYSLLTAQGTAVLVAPIDASASAAALAANLAILAAQDGETTILVDADPHVPSLDTLFELTAPVSFRDLALSDSTDIAGALNSVADVPGLYVIAAGGGTPIPGGIGKARHLPDVLARLKASADRVILVGARILEHVDSLDLCRYVDGVVITLTPGKTHRLDAGRARDLLDRVKAPVLGVVLTGKPS